MDLVQFGKAGRRWRASAAGRARCKTLLLDVPFRTIRRPSIGLGLLAAVLGRAGYDCSVRYVSLEFASLIGLPVYRVIGEEVPELMLAGDLVFAPAVDPRSGDFTELRRRGPLYIADGSPIGYVPNWVWGQLPTLQAQASLFAERCAESIAATDARLVGFSCMFQTLPSLAIAKALKARAPDKLIVFGGAHCEGEMGLALHEAYPFIDFVARGEGEELLVDLVAALAGEGPPLESIPGLVWREQGRSRAAGARARRIDDLDALPTPDYSEWITAVQKEFPALSLHDLELPFEASRGCWYGEKHHCTFCGLNGETMAFRSRSAARVIDELRALNRYGIYFLYAVDLILDHRYFETLLPMLAREQHDHSLFFETKSNLTRRQVELLCQANVRMIQPGIESLSTQVLALMRKGVTAYQNVRLLKWAAEYGLAVFWSLLYGFPRELPEDYQALVELLPSLTHLMPPQGGYRARIDRFSPLLDEAAALGVGRPRPAMAYASVHALPPAMLERLAYFFEDEDDCRSFEYMEPVAVRLRQWREGFGRTSFVSIDREGVLRLYDTRPVATASTARLEGLERTVFLACDAGASAAAIAGSLGQPEEQVRRVLDGFAERRWVAALDGRYLSLAVAFDSTLPAGLPEAVLPSICHALYTKRITSLGRIVIEETQPPTEIAAGAGWQP